MTILLGSLVEAKAWTVSLSKKPNEGSTFNVDIKAVIQPKLELMAMAEVAKFPEEEVPVVNIFGGKMGFGPFIYFKKLDVMLTTLNVIPLRPTAESLNMLGLLVLFSLFQFHKLRHISFFMEEVSKLPKTGWRRALETGMDNYQNSEVYVPTGTTGMPHANAQIHMHSSSESQCESDGHCAVFIQYVLLINNNYLKYHAST